MKRKKKSSLAPIYHFQLINVSCASCVRSIEQALKKLPGVQNFQINFADRSLTVRTTESIQTIIRTIEHIGYDIKLAEGPSSHHKMTMHSERAKPLFLKAITGAFFGVILFVLGLLNSKMHWPLLSQTWFEITIGVLTAGVILFVGGRIYQRAFKQLFHLHVTMDTLIMMGTLAAWIYSMLVVIFPHLVPLTARHVYFETAVIILAFVVFGSALEISARRKTGDAIQSLMNLQPKTASVIRDEQILTMPVENIVLGDIIRIRSGETIPVDGEIVKGESHIDESMLTGEPMPVLKKFGDKVIGGTLNKLGSFLFKATGVGKETVLSQIIEMVRHAQQTKPPIAKLVNKVASVFVPIVIIVAIITAAIWYFAGPISIRVNFMWVTAIAVLVIACPYALGLATPISIVVGMGKAAQAGILIRNGEALQNASRLTTVVLDKTGTITKGHPEVTLCHALKNFSEEKLLQWTASLELHSEHPIAEAIVNASQKKKLVLLPVQKFQAIVGQGVKGEIEESEVLFGNDTLMHHYEVNIDPLFVLQEELSAQGKTPMFLAIDRKPVGFIAIADPIKIDSKMAIEKFKKLKLKVVMLTGDNEKTAERIAGQVGIDHVIANVLPQDKARHIEQLQAKGERVGMVGDGINDAPALAQADIGFAIGAAPDVAINASDVTLMQSSIHQVIAAIILSRRVMRNIKQNLFFAFIYNICAIPVAGGILYPFIKLLLNPMIAAAAMALSSVTVVMNASRLKWFKIR